MSTSPSNPAPDARPKGPAKTPGGVAPPTPRRPRLIVGLGNPGRQYDGTRHNAGFWLADQLASRWRAAPFKADTKLRAELSKAHVSGHDVWLAKPLTFMNLSGEAAQAIARFYRVEPDEILIAHDDLDLSPGDARLKFGGGHGGQNGLRNLTQHLGEGYARARIGIGHPGDKNLVLNYVLGRAGRDEQARMDEAVTRTAEAVDAWFAHGWDRALHDLHSAAPKARR